MPAWNCQHPHVGRNVILLSSEVLSNENCELNLNPVVAAAHAGHREHLAFVVFALVQGLALDLKAFLWMLRKRLVSVDMGAPSTTIAPTAAIRARILLSPSFPFPAAFRPESCSPESDFPVTRWSRSDVKTWWWARMGSQIGVFMNLARVLLLSSMATRIDCPRHQPGTPVEMGC